MKPIDNHAIAKNMLLEKSTIKQAPQNVGVYIFKDKKGRTLYVGKAKNLKKRLLSYINYKNNQRPQTNFLMDLF